MLKSTSPAPHIFIVWSRNSHLGDFDLGMAKGVGGGGRGWGVKEKGRASLNPINGYAVLQRRLFALLSFMKLVKRRGVDNFTPQLSLWFGPLDGFFCICAVMF